MIAEAWDAAGLYQVGNFVGDSWKEWNDRFRDDIRDFFRGAHDTVGRAADRLLGSPSIYGWKERELEESINFVACHDGFTLNDVVSYDHKHNEENGEDNRDGSAENRSWNCGFEGPTDDTLIEGLRNRQVKNFLTALMLSGGVPMFVMGDELRRSQRGNNNPYCQDNETSWFDWNLPSKHADVLRFVKLLIERRMLRDMEHEHWRASLRQVLRETKHAWHGTTLNKPDWSPDSHSIAIGGELKNEAVLVHTILNAYWEPLDFELPLLSGGNKHWRRWIDTALDPPHEICEWNAEPEVPDGTYRAEARSVVVLIADNRPMPDISTGVK
jgi:glycogen operon protein